MTEKKRKADFFIGTSGWSYRHWKGLFYPEDLEAGAQLPFYQQQFNTVEINVSFYRLPFENLVKRWAKIAPPGFLYSLKASRTITHLKKLKDAAEPVKRLFERIAPLREHLGVVLFQLPPSMKRSDALLEKFLASLPKGFRYAVEFRDESWHGEAVYEILRRHEVAYCILSSPKISTVLVATGPFVYVRFHGMSAYYRDNYPDRVLRQWAKDIVALSDGVERVFIYFNNDYNAYAVENAKTLRGFIEKMTV
jgi:uncharacterized protein YecE (DUF72 family)